VADHVREACGDPLFELFLVNICDNSNFNSKPDNVYFYFLKSDPDGLYAKMTPIQADVCRSNKINIPYRSSA
jgi:hypothetical protein